MLQSVWSAVMDAAWLQCEVRLGWDVREGSDLERGSDEKSCCYEGESGRHGILLSAVATEAAAATACPLCVSTPSVTRLVTKKTTFS